jgi:hypothetical protein
VSTTATDSPRRPASQGRPARPLPALPLLLAVESATLAVFSTLHLTGALRIGTGNSDGAGVAEALICLALAGGAWALARSSSPARGRLVGLFAVGFAIAGFIVGLTFTVRGGDAIDLIYHATMLPILALTAVLVARRTTPNHL